MAEIPSIIVQIIHMEGPGKGQIQELTDQEIFIGRHADCQVCFPSDLKVISRKHAVIRREGNRFKIIDMSSNGTIVNGKNEKEVFLKNGDVITITQGGPKFSFLTQIGAGSSVAPLPPSPPQPPQPAVVQTQPPLSQVQHTPSAPSPPVQPAISNPPPQAPVQAAPAQQPSIQKVKAPLIIQYGPTLQNFDELPVIIGNQPSCHWHLDHAGIQGQQAQIWFDQGEYWVKDMTGTGLVTVQGAPVGNGMQLNQEMQLSLSPQGPVFKFLGNGRLAEVEAPPTPQKIAAQQPPPFVNQQQQQSPVENIAENISKKAKSLIGKYWKK